MIIGRENPKLDPTRIPELIRKDDEKLAIAASLGVRWLGYPLLDDEYSRLDVSFRLAGDDWPIAAAFEQRLERVPGVSMGDTRQVASLVHGFDDADVSYRPTIQWLVSEDEALRVALQNEVAAGRLPELINVQVRSVTEFVAAA